MQRVCVINNFLYNKISQYQFEKKCTKCDCADVVSVTKDDSLQLCSDCKTMYKASVIVPPEHKLSPKTINVKKINDTLVLRDLHKLKIEFI